MKYVKTLTIYPAGISDDKLKETLSRGFIPWVMTDDGRVVAFNRQLWFPSNRSMPPKNNIGEFSISNGTISYWNKGERRWKRACHKFDSIKQLLEIVGLPPAFPILEYNNAIGEFIRVRSQEKGCDMEIYFRRGLAWGFCAYAARGLLYGKWNFTNQ